MPKDQRKILVQSQKLALLQYIGYTVQQEERQNKPTEHRHVKNKAVSIATHEQSIQRKKNRQTERGTVVGPGDRGGGGGRRGRWRQEEGGGEKRDRSAGWRKNKEVIGC